MNQVEQHPLEALGIGVGEEASLRDLGSQMHALGLRRVAERLDRLVDEVVERDLLHRPADLAGFDPSQLEEVVHEGAERPDVGVHGLLVAPPGGLIDQVIVQRIDDQAHRRDWRAQIVRGGGHQVTPGPVRACGSRFLG